MEEREVIRLIERAFANGIEVGTIQLSAQLGLIDEKISPNEAYAKYGGKKQVEEWRRKRWIVGYPTGNKTRSKFYFKRSELETAQRMLDMVNIIPPNTLFRKDNQEDLDRSYLKEVRKRIDPI